MKEQLISVETAKLAKEKGFNEETFGHHYIDNNDDHLFPHAITGFNEALKWNSILEDSFFKALYRGLEIKEIISVPTQSFLQQWLREKHNIECYVVPFYRFGEIGYQAYYGNVFTDFKPLTGEIGGYLSHNTYEKAFDAGLQESLKLI